MSELEALLWFRNNAPKGTTIFTCLKKTSYWDEVNDARTANAYIFTYNLEDGIQAHWLDKRIEALEIVTLHSRPVDNGWRDEIWIEGRGFNMAQEIAKRIGKAVWDDEHAYKFELL